LTSFQVPMTQKYTVLMNQVKEVKGQTQMLPQLHSNSLAEAHPTK